MIIGMDFGTTNSGMATYDGRSVRILPLDPDSPNPRVLQTALYVTNEQRVHIGRAAVDHYYGQNVGRPVQLRKVWIGELEIYAEDLYYVTDAYAWVDILSPGRLFLSIKSSLRDTSYPGTVVGQFYYPLEDLIALYFSVTKVRAEQMLGQELDRIVLGRPVRFSQDPERDRAAQARLLQAALRAGYEAVYLQPEPIAAAYSYEQSLTAPQNVLVFDFGGGTLDLTVIRLGERPRRVLATGGIPIAGDVFDQKLARDKLPPHFGEGSTYGSRRRPQQIPKWVYDSFSDWQKMLELQTAENRQMLQEIARTSRRRYQIEALIGLVSGNYGLKMFDVVEKAKRRLSQKRGAEIRLEGSDFKVVDFVTRTAFERLIRPEMGVIEEHLLETVAASGLAPAEIDAVIRTGGSSQIPAFYQMLCRHFGREKVQSVDTFSSVTAGLGIMAHEVATGELDLAPHTPDTVKTPPQESQPTVPPVNLAVAQRRIALEEGAGEAVAAASEVGLVALATDGTVTAVSLPPSRLEEERPLPLAGLDLPAALIQIQVAGLDAPLLLVTNVYRFLRFTPRQLMEIEAANLTIADQYPLQRLERICAIGHWGQARAEKNLLLVTSQGIARPFPIAVLGERIEAPVPYKFDHPLEGEVVAALGAGDAGDVILITAGARAVRYPLSALRLSGTQALNCGGEDRVVAARVVDPAAELALVTADGYGRRLPAAWIPQPARENGKGKSLVARRSPLAAMGMVEEERPLWLITTHRLLPAPLETLPRQQSTKTRPLLSLDAGERVQGVVSW